jgi:hypothetical protein
MRAAAALLVLLAACAPVRNRPEARYQGILLNARDLGAGELRRLAADDPTLGAYVEREGQPDFLLQADARDVELIYVRASKVVLFRRPADDDGPTVVGTASPLPTPILSLLPSDLRAGTGEPFPDTGTSCWTVDAGAERCRTCCAAPVACEISCAPLPAR